MRSLIRFALLLPFDWFRELLLPRYRLYLWFFSACPPALTNWLGFQRAVRAAEDAQRRVPAYRAFLESRGVSAAEIASLEIPFTDKVNYIKAFPTELRCVGGRLPLVDAAIDESSGTSGTPYNWIRSMKERRYSHLFISHFARYCYGEGPWITINAFSMGAWATGINMGIALQRNSLVKNVGPDADKILHTLEFFGKDYTYLICGYPPFLKQLIDAALAGGFPLTEYRLMAMLGGEGNSEGLRDYLLKHFECAYSGYGATDLEIGIAGETPTSLALRRQARSDERLRAAAFGSAFRPPMLFQYNPLTHHVIVNAEGELMFTITQLHLISPRVMYNIHDEGGVCTYAEMEARVGAVDIKLHGLIGEGRKPIRLPFLWVYGRSDSTVSIMGANIYPEDIEQCLYDEPDLARLTRSYCISLSEANDASVRPYFAFELTCPPDPALQAAFEDWIPRRLVALNADYRAAMDEHPGAAMPIISLFPEGAGPFAADAARIKQVRVLKAPAGA